MPFPSKEQRDMTGAWLRLPTRTTSCLRIGRAWTVLGGLDGPSGAQPILLKRVPRHMAQPARISCLEMWDSCPHIFYTFCPRRWLFIHCCFYIYCLYHINCTVNNPSLILLFLRLKINHIKSCNDCVFTLVLVVS